MRNLTVCIAFMLALSTGSTAYQARNEALTNIVLVHGAWVDALGWKQVSDILTGRCTQLPTPVTEGEEVTS